MYKRQREICRGKYGLVPANGVPEPGEIEVSRPLGVPLIGERPSAPTRPGGDAACGDVVCQGHPDGFAACKPGEGGGVILCECQGGAAGNSGRCGPKTTCQDDGAGFAFCKEGPAGKP